MYDENTRFHFKYICNENKEFLQLSPKKIEKPSFQEIGTNLVLLLNAEEKINNYFNQLIIDLSDTLDFELYFVITYNIRLKLVELSPLFAITAKLFQNHLIDDILIKSLENDSEDIKTIYIKKIKAFIRYIKFCIAYVKKSIYIEKKVFKSQKISLPSMSVESNIKSDIPMKSYVIYDFKTLINTLLYGLINSKNYIRQCKNCGSYFLTTTAQRRYCDKYSKYNTSQSCNSILKRISDEDDSTNDKITISENDNYSKFLKCKDIKKRLIDKFRYYAQHKLYITKSSHILNNQKIFQKICNEFHKFITANYSNEKKCKEYLVAYEKFLNEVEEQINLPNPQKNFEIIYPNIIKKPFDDD